MFDNPNSIDSRCVALICAQSVDGFITCGDTPGSEFASPEDQVWFAGCLKSAEAVIMGSPTYRVARKSVRAASTSEQPRYVLTRRPEQFGEDARKDALIFTDAGPVELISKLTQDGRKNIALIGGGETNRRFLEAGCVDQIWVTVEPLLFGRGVGLCPGVRPQSLRLIEHRLLATDTLLLKYRIDQV